uniref:SH3 domain-containing protein n=1 Tax=Acetatifactor sp. TaxID=1872090 RepID=UPI004057ABBA
MRETKEFKWSWKLLTAISSLMLVLALGLLVEPFSIVSHAESQGKVIATSAKIREEANTSSEALGSAAHDSVVSIRSQVTGSDGMVWYEVFVDADTLGFIRSDLVQITDGTTPPTSTGTTSNTDNNNGNTNENLPEVTAVQPMSAAVKGSQNVRVRAGASTGSAIVSMAKEGLALTVTGQANGTDGKVWYQVTFISDNQQVTGFIRSDYVTLDGELVPVTEETVTPPTEEVPAEPETPVEPPVVVKAWDTQEVDGKWYIIDNEKGENYEINYLFESVATNRDAYEAAQKKVKSQQAWIIILVILAIALAGTVAFLIFKMKDMKDSAYFAEVEKETLRRRTADRPSGSGRVMHTVGAERKSGGTSVQGEQRPTGARPARGQGGQRPAGARPTQGQGSQRPAGARPAQGQGGQRPTGAPAQGQGNQRPAGAPAQGQGGQKTAAARPTAAPAQKSAEQEVRQSVTPRTQQGNNTENAGWKSKNFMTEDDEFEFEFLNWDGEDEE